MGCAGTTRARSTIRKESFCIPPTLSDFVFQEIRSLTLYDPFTPTSSPLGFASRHRRRPSFAPAFGLYYDTPNLNPFLDNRPGNGAPNGVEGNPGGPPSDTVTTATAGGYTIQQGVNVFPPGAGSDSIFSIAKNFVPSHNLNYNLQIERSLSNKVVGQFGYVGSAGRHLLSIVDINQALPGVYDTSAKQNATRPFYSAFPAYTFIDKSKASAIQTTIRCKLPCVFPIYTGLPRSLPTPGRTPLTRSPLIAAPSRKTAETPGRLWV